MVWIATIRWVPAAARAADPSSSRLRARAPPTQSRSKRPLRLAAEMQKESGEEEGLTEVEWRKRTAERLAKERAAEKGEAEPEWSKDLRRALACFRN